MHNHIIGIDHAVVAVRDLEAAAETFRRLGFVVTPRGGHPEWGTANHCLMFGRTYVELLAATGEGDMARRVSAWLERNGEGLMAMAWGTDDGAAAAQALRQAGIGAETPRALSRKLWAPEGELTPLFSVVGLPPGATPGITSFLCQHLTPDLLRRPAWLAHENGALGIDSVTAVVDDPDQAMWGYGQVFGPGAATPTDNTVAVHTGNGLILLCRPDDLTQLHPEADLEPEPQPPAMVALTITVADTGQAAAALAAHGVPHHRDAEGTVRVAPEQACGVFLEFMAAR